MICDRSKLHELGCHSPPDLVVKVLCKENSKKEIKDKFDFYEDAGVKEYWIMDYLRRTVVVNHLTDSAHYQPLRSVKEGDVVSSIIFPTLRCTLNDIFNGVPDRLGEPETEYHN